MSTSPHGKLWPWIEQPGGRLLKKGLHSFEEALAEQSVAKRQRTGQQQTSPAHSAEETATPTSACLVTPDVVSDLLPNVQHHSLSRLTDAYNSTQ